MSQFSMFVEPWSGKTLWKLYTISIRFCYSFLGFLIEQVNFGEIAHQLYVFSYLSPGLRIHTRYDVVVSACQPQVNICSHRLHHGNGGLDNALRLLFCKFPILNIFRPKAENHPFPKKV